MVPSPAQAIAISLLTLLALASCANTGMSKPNVDYMADYDFSEVKTFAYLPYREGPSPSGALSAMEIDRMHRAFARALEAKGMVLVKSRDKADILASWHLVVQEGTSVRSYDASSYYQCWGCGPAVSDVSVRQYTRGTLIFDLVDPALRKSVWRSVVQSEISQQRNVAGQQQRFDKIAARLLAEFPPH